MKNHLIRVFNNKLSVAIIILFILIPCIEVAQLYFEKMRFGAELHPAKAFFLAGSSIGHATQIILIWFLPLYLMLVSADYPIQDYQTGMHNVLICKVGKKKYHLNVLLKSFVTSYLLMYVALIINLVLVVILFHGGTSFRGIENGGLDHISFVIEHPYLTDYYYIIVASFIAGLVGMVCTSFSLFFKDKKYAYATSFIFWLWLIVRENSITYVFQPFTEYSMDLKLPIMVFSTVVMVAVCIVIYLYEVKYSEV